MSSDRPLMPGTLDSFGEISNLFDSGLDSTGFPMFSNGIAGFSTGLDVMPSGNANFKNGCG